MAINGNEVVIVGGGVVGLATAYFLGKAGVRSVVVERDSVGSHASGFAYGGLSPLAGAGIPGPVDALATEGMRLHTQFSTSLPDQTGVNTEYRLRPSLPLAFTEEEVRAAKAALAWQQKRDECTVRWVDAIEVKVIEPRISPEALGGLYVGGTADVEPYRFSLALAHSSEKLGASIRHGRVTGLKRRGERVVAVEVGGDEIPCERVVIAMGPWSGGASEWLGVPIDVSPLKGQILRLLAPGAPFQCSIGWAGNYATTKPDGLLWAGTTEEEAEFNEAPTSEARDVITASLLKMVPSLSDAQLVQQTACLRPVTPDGLPVLGPVPGWDGVYAATGAGRKGILLGPAMGRVTADLITRGATDIPLEGLSPARFSA